jgi:hypothetical protein
MTHGKTIHICKFGDFFMLVIAWQTFYYYTVFIFNYISKGITAPETKQSLKFQ